MALSMKDFEDYLKGKNVSPVCLDSQCDDKILRTVSRSMGDWRTLAMYFESDVKAIEHENSEEEPRRYAMLTRWKKKKAFKATYRNLVSNFLEAGNAELAQKVCDELAKNEASVQEKETSIPKTAQATASARPVPELKLVNILDELHEAGFSSAHWEDLGLQLGMESHVLSTIEDDGKNNQSRLSSMITRWLNHDLECSWNKLADAVSKVQGKNAGPVVAKKLPRD